MLSLSIEQAFGLGAFQDNSILVIQKASLLRLTPVASNTAESLLVAILITVLSALQGNITDENNQPITDENNQPITFDNSDFYQSIKIIPWQPFQVSRNNQLYIQHQIIHFSYVSN